MKRRAFTVVELLVIIAIIGILIGMILPAIQRTNGPARRTYCLNQLRQIALASLNYESVHMVFPSATGIEAFKDIGSGNQLSGMVAILPFLEQNNLYDQIVKPLRIDGVDYPACPPLYAAGVPHWETRIPWLKCPSIMVDGGGVAPAHYGFCIGDRARNIASPNTLRGAFGNSRPIGFGDINDGSSNTFLAAEICARQEGGREIGYAINQPPSILDDPSQCFELTEGKPAHWEFAKGVPLSPIGRGGHWADGRAGPALFNTILPPNSPSVAVDGDIGVDGIYSASGPHPGSVNVVLCDGSCHSIDLEIDAGDSASPAPTEEEMAAGATSPYGIWGALGTINGGEVVDWGTF